MLGAHSYGHQLRVAVGVLHRFDRIFGSKSSHHEGQLAVGCSLDRKPINPQHVLGSMRTATVDFHNKLDVFHGSFRFLNWPGWSWVLATDTNLDRLGFAIEKIPSGSTVRLTHISWQQSSRR
jgi:hypothetical protein